MIGASLRRKEDRRLLTGAGRFLDDLVREDMIHLGVVRSIHAHARIIKIVAREALAIPGVVAAWGAADLPEVSRSIPKAYGEARKGRPFAQPVLAGDVARYVGEAVAIVLADGAARVADALQAVTVEYEPLPALTTAEEALRSPARLHDGWPDNRALTVRGEVGDVALGFAQADVVIHERFTHPRLSAMPLEAAARRPPGPGHRRAP